MERWYLDYSLYAVGITQGSFPLVHSCVDISDTVWEGSVGRNEDDTIFLGCNAISKKEIENTIPLQSSKIIVDAKGLWYEPQGLTFVEHMTFPYIPDDGFRNDEVVKGLVPLHARNLLISRSDVKNGSETCDLRDTEWVTIYKKGVHLTFGSFVRRKIEFENKIVDFHGRLQRFGLHMTYRYERSATPEETKEYERERESMRKRLQEYEQKETAENVT